MDEWLAAARDRIAAESGLDPEDLALSEEDETVLLDLARIAAHESGERTNAPLLSYLVERASFRYAELERLAAAVRSD